MKISTQKWHLENNISNALLQIGNNIIHWYSFAFLAISLGFELLHVIVSAKEEIHSLIQISIP